MATGLAAPRQNSLLRSAAAARGFSRQRSTDPPHPVRDDSLLPAVIASCVLSGRLSWQPDCRLVHTLLHALSRRLWRRGWRSLGTAPSNALNFVYASDDGRALVVSSRASP